MDKMKMRKKALESMMSEAPSMEYKKRGMMEDEMEMPEMPGEMDKSELKEQSMVQFMVSPEEKKMILEMRSKGGKGEPEESESEEMEMDY